MKELGLLLLMLVSGFNIGGWWAKQDYKDMHCTPITKHIGIESAKAQVSAYQAMTRG